MIASIFLIVQTPRPCRPVIYDIPQLNDHAAINN
jgi:hypothetical protein